MSQLIPEDIIQEVLLRADIMDVIGDYVQLKQTGANAKGLCPFHQEKTPSFTVSPTKGLFYCFGCHASGDVLRFLMQYENLPFPEAVRLLAARYGVRLPDTPAEQRHEDRLAPLYALHQAAARFFHECLRRDPAAQPARVACQQRLITQEMAMRFGLGYAPASWDVLYQTMHKQGFSQDVLAQSGLIVVREAHNGAYDRFRHRLIFPIHDRLGRPIAFGGRALEGGEAVHVPKYLNSPETPIFQKGRLLYGFALAKAAMRQKGQVLIMEGYTDVIACHRQGVTHAVGTMGTALTAQHVGLLKGLVKEAVLVFDGDAAGGAATERSIALFLDAGIRVRVVVLPDGEDPDSFLRQHSGAALMQHVDDAVGFVDYLLTRAARFTDLRHPAGQADCAARLAPLLRKIDNQVERWGYEALVSERLGIPPEVLRREMYPHQPWAARAAYRPSGRTSRPPSPTRVLPEYTLLHLLCHDTRLMERVQPHLPPEEIQDADLRAIYAALLRLPPESSDATVFLQLSAVATTTGQTAMLSRMAAEEIPTHPAEIQAALQDCLAKIHQRQPKAQRQRLIGQLRAAREAGNVEDEQRLLQAYHQLSQTQTLQSAEQVERPYL